LYRNVDLVDEDICVMNKYSELSRVWSIKHSKLYANFCSLDNTFHCKVSYTSFLQTLHTLILLNTWYNRWSTHFITYIRRRTISVYHINSH